MSSPPRLPSSLLLHTMSKSSIPKFDGTGAAIVTGSAQGIGKAVALRLAKDGYHVVLNDLTSQEDKLRETQQEILSTYAGVKCTFVTGDVSKEEDVMNLVETAVKEFGDLAQIYTGVKGLGISSFSLFSFLLA